MTDIPQFLTDSQAIRDDYARELQLRRQREVAAFDTAVQKDPTLFAKQRQLSRLTDIPQDAVEARYDEIQKVMRAKALDDAARFAANPVLAVHLRNPDFVSMVHDDLAELQRAEGLFDWVGQQWDSGSLTRRRGEIGARVAAGWATVGELQELYQLESRLRSIPKRVGLIERTVGGTLEILGQWLPSIPTALATGAGGASIGAAAGPAGAAAGFSKGFAMGMGAQAVITEGGSAYLDFIQAGYAPENARGAALGVGLVNGALEYVGFRMAAAPTAALLRKTVGRRFASEVTQQTAGALWGSAAKEYLTTVGSEVVTEVLQETTNIAAEELLRAYTRPELASKLSTEAGREEVTGRILDIAQKTFDGMLLLGLPGPVARLRSDLRRAEVVDSQTKILEALQKGAAIEPKLLERAPDLFHQFTADAANGAVPELTVEASALLQVLRDMNTAQAEAGRARAEKSVTESVQAKLPELLKDLEAKAERGEDVTIQTADFVTHLAKTPLGAELLRHMRVDPDALSQSELERSNPLLKELTEEAKKIVGEAQGNAKQILESAKKVMTRQLEELKATGRFQGVEARANARLYTTFVVVNAARAKMTPEEFDEQFRLTTTAQGTGQLQQASIEPPSYGTPVEGADSVLGVHFTREPRAALSGEFYGTGLKGAEARRVSGDPTLSKRVHFYVDTGSGIKQEPGTGDVRTEARLTNVYNTDTDKRGLVQAWRDSGSRDFNELEQAIVNAGFDGIFVPRAQRIGTGEGTQGVVTLLGPRHSNVPVSVVQDNRLFRQTVSIRSGKESLKRYGLTPGKRYTVRQVATALETRQRAKYGSIDPKDRSPESAQRIAKWMAEEVEFEAGNPDSGLGWYSVKFQQALDTAGELFPELKSGQTARGVLTALVAITSDGQEPIGNFKQALGIYAGYRDSKKLTSERGTARQASVRANMEVLQKLFDIMGEARAFEYLLSEDTVGNLKKAAAEAGGTFVSAFTVDTKVPMAALELGPKLGSFFANLMGRAGYLTMDRWWSRTFNRYRGTLVQKPTVAGLARFKEAMGHPEWTDEEAAAATVPLRKSYEAKDFKDGTDLEKMANTIFRAAFLELEDTPFNASDRSFMLDAAGRAQKLLKKKKGLDLTIADIQAALWYYEKRLYGELGAKDSGKVAFDVAARRAVEELNGQRTGVSDGGVERSVPADAAGEVDPEFTDGSKVDTTPTGEKSVLLNIGLDIPGGGKLTVEQVLDAIHGTGATVLRHATKQSDSEQTVIAAINDPLSKEIGDKLSETLKQEAIVQRLPDSNGALFGPMAEKWGAYNPAYFVMLDGTRASDVKPGDNTFRQGGAGFFSALLRGVQALNVKSLTADGWKQQLKGLQNKGVVKAEELEWTGVTDWLDLQEGKVTREAVVAYLQERGVRVETRDGGGLYYEYVTLAGGTNYSETLLMLPPPPGLRQYRSGDEILGNEDLTDRWGARVVAKTADVVDLYGSVGEALQAATEDGGADPDVVDLLDHLRVMNDNAVARAGAYKSSHWGTPNVLAHVRTSDFSGGQVLRVHELQSDWGQAARERGTVDKAKLQRLELAEIDALDALRAANEAVARRVDEVVPNSLTDSRGQRSETDQAALDADPEYLRLVQEVRKASDARLTARRELKEYTDSFTADAPPDGPFIRTTEGWLNLALKKLLMIAVEGGYQRVEFATGAEVAKMFSLDQAVQSVAVREPTKADSTGIDRVVIVEMRDERGTSEFEVNADGTIENANDFAAADQVVGKQLSELLGAEAAQWVMSAPFGEERRGGDFIQSEGMRGFYDKIVPAAASKLVKKLGGKITSADRLQIEITDEMREQVAAGLPLFQEGDGPRGWFDPERLRIILSQSSDSSTWLHELGHYFLTVYSKLAEMPQVDPRVAEDMQTLLDWFGVADIATWNVMPVAEQRKYHETFAYNFEQWLFEGKAPTPAQQRLFDRFMDFIRAAYRTMLAEVFRSKLDAAYRTDTGEALPQLSPEVRAVMGRMLAAEDEIRSATARDGAVPLFQTQEEFVKAGGNEDDWAELQELATAANDAAVASLTQDSLRQMVWLRNARGKVLRRLQKEQDSVREKLREEEVPRMALLRTYRAMEWLQFGVVRNEAGEVVNHSLNHRLNRDAVKAIEPELSMSLVRRYTSANGVLPDDAATMFGYPSGDEMVKALIDAPPLADAIENRVQQRLLEEYAGLTDPKSIERAIDKALHNDARTRFVAAELRHLMRAEEPVRKMVAAAKEAARVGLLNRKVNELNPRVFVRGERRASQKAFEALRRGDTDGAVVAKRQQLLQEQLALQAIEASQEIDDALRSFEPITKPDEKVGKTREIALVGAARALLAAYQIGGSKEQRAAMLSRATELLEQVKAYQPAMFTEVAELIGASLAGATDYRQLTLAQFRVLRDTVQSLWWQAKRRKQIEVEGKLQDRQTALDAISADLAPKVPAGPLPGANEAPTLRQRVVRRFQGLRSAARRAESLFDSLGPSLTRFLFRPVQDSLDAYRVKRNELVKAFVDKLGELGKLPIGKIAAPELGYTFGAGNGGIGLAELLGAMLHTGNDSNMAKLLIGRGWVDPAEPFVGDVVNTSKWGEFMARLERDGVITKAHWDWVQSVWDLLEQTKPLAQKAHKALFGHYFKEVKSRPVQTSFGNYRGGYVPAKTDTFLVRDARINEGMEALEADFRQSLPTVGMGFTKARVEDYRKALSLDVRKIASHIDSVIRFAYVQPAIRDVLSMLRDPTMSTQLNAIDPVAVEGVMLPWLTRAARQTTEQAGVDPTIDQFWRTVRTRTGMSTMFLNLSNATQQLTGWFPAALKVKGSYLKGAMRRYSQAPKQVADEVAELSPFMANRFKNQMFELTDSLNEVLLNPNKFQKLQKWAGRHTYVLQSAMQNMVDAVTWVGAHEQALADGAAQTDAIAAADAAVRLTQGSNDADAVSRFEAGSPFMRTLTQFSGYFNMLANLNLTEFYKTVKELGWKGGSAKLFHVFMLGFAAPMLVSDAIARTFSGEWDDEDDDGYTDEVASWFFGGLGRGALALAPLGTVVSPLVNAWNDKPYDDRMMTSPAVSALEAATVGVIRATQVAFDPERDVTGKGVRDVLTLLTLLTGLPLSALGRPIGYAMDVSADRVEPYGVADTVRGLVTGRPAPGTRQP